MCLKSVRFNLNYFTYQLCSSVFLQRRVYKNKVFLVILFLSFIMYSIVCLTVQCVGKASVLPMTPTEYSVFKQIVPGDHI
jgi:hypothetical protein